MKLAVTGGKGGTGKSTLATSLAYEMAQSYKTLLVDCDVECPDDHLLLSIDRIKVKDVESLLPSFNFESCLKCGKCSETCRQNAIVFVTGHNPMLIPDQCNGCGACILTCPTNSITEDFQVIGTIYEGHLSGRKSWMDNFLLISGEVAVGCEASTLVVNATRLHAAQYEKDYHKIIIDTAAGTHCNVIAALINTDLALAVTEPTPLGKHDLKLILQLLKKMDIKTQIMLNRANMGNPNLIKDLSEEFGFEIVLKIPYQRAIIERYSRGLPAFRKMVSPFVKSLEGNL